MGIVELKDMGLVPYATALELQQGIFEGVQEGQNGGGENGGVLILLEHPHVYTLGKSGALENLLIDRGMLERIGAEYHQSDRGGDITYHGPGQLVGYPILPLERIGIGLRDYIWRLEEAIIQTIAEFGIEGQRIEGATGVWIGGEAGGGARGGAGGEAGGGGKQGMQGAKKGAKKIAAIGVRASRGVTMHGFALNVCTDLSYFSHINPCGFKDRGVTSVEKEGGQKIEMAEVKRIFAKAFEQQFSVRLQTK